MRTPAIAPFLIPHPPPTWFPGLKVTPPQSTGECECIAGFTGADCSSNVPAAVVTEPSVRCVRIALATLTVARCTIPPTTSHVSNPVLLRNRNLSQLVPMKNVQNPVHIMKECWLRSRYNLMRGVLSHPQRGKRDGGGGGCETLTPYHRR